MNKIVASTSLFIILFLLMFSFQIFNQSFSPSGYFLSEREKKLVTKIIDGDTIIVEGGETIRLLGIDADEKGERCYEVAKKRLEELILNKEVLLERDKTNKDKYGRYLRYVILGKENINIKLVKEGLAIARIGEDVTKYKKEIVEAEHYAMKNKIGCKWGLEK